MSRQNYRNHKMYYVPHHFIFLPLMSVLMIGGAWNAYNKADQRLQWTLFSLLCFCILYLAIMIRQHYALGNQDRIVRLEFRVRYFELFGKSASDVEKHLNFSQIAALRFASDDELPGALEKALKNGDSADQIKKSIKDWQPDQMRV